MGVGLAMEVIIISTEFGEHKCVKLPVACFIATSGHFPHHRQQFCSDVCLKGRKNRIQTKYI